MDLNISVIAPELSLLAAVACIIIMDLLMRRRTPAILLEGLAFAGLAAAFVITLGQWGSPVETAFSGRLVADGLALFLRALIILVGIATVIASSDYLKREKLETAEYLILTLFSLIGMMILVSATELITLFLGLEIVSMALYVLAGFKRDEARSLEASLKYFLLGAFASAILLLGLALLWGSTGSLYLSGLREAFATGELLHPPLAMTGFWLLVVGLVFKISLAPFHFWAADVYEGSPAPVAGFMATGTKAAAFGALARFLLVGFGDTRADWVPVLIVLSVLTMGVGNFMAIAQANIKRMLAFSSVAHAGYILLAIVAGTEHSMRALLVYLAAYSLMTLGAFTVVAIAGGKGEKRQSIYEYAGLGKRDPWLAAFLTVFLLSLAGIPPALGFIGKFLVFAELVRGGFVGLTVVAVLFSLVSAYYYLRVIYLIYMREALEEIPAVGLPRAAGMLLIIILTLIIILGIFPAGLMELVGASPIAF
jgi:NADH-quinone oxidoreductase subunit N